MFGVLTSEQSRQMAAGINLASLQYLPVKLSIHVPGPIGSRVLAPWRDVQSFHISWQER